MGGMNEFVTREDIRQLIEALSKTDLYIKESIYRLQIGLSRTHFHYLRKAGRFNGGYCPFRRIGNGRKRFMHRFWNMHSGQIEIPGLNCTAPITPLRKARSSGSKKAKEEASPCSLLP